MSGAFPDNGTPWQEAGERSILFLLCAQSATERRLLRDWIEATRPARAADAEEAVVAPGNDDQTPRHTGLSRLLEGNDPRFVVPLRISWKTGSKLPKRIDFRKLLTGTDLVAPRLQQGRIVRQQPERVLHVVGAGATVSELHQRFVRTIDVERGGAGAFAGFVARQAMITLDQTETRLAGTRYKLPRFTVDAVMARREFTNELQMIADDGRIGFDKAYSEAHDCLSEIAAVPSPFFIDVMAALNKYMSTRSYGPELVVDQSQIESLRQLVRTQPTALLFTHKTHVDAPVVSRILYENDLPPLHMFGGINMAFGGLGALAKRAGAVYIRRSFKGQPIYRLALMRYIHYLMEKRFPLAWSIEGGRSRTGKLIPPRYGLMKYVMEAAEATKVERLHLIPVSIAYDLIPEVADYVHEQGGGTKQKESLQWFIKYLASLDKPLGRIHVNFGKAVVVGQDTEMELVAPDDGNGAFSLALQKAAFQVCVNINEVTPATATSLITTALLGAAPQALTADELRAEIVLLADWMEARELPMTDDVRSRDRGHILGIVDSMIEAGVISRYDEGPETIYLVPPEQQLTASYYRNNAIHLLLNNALLELALVTASEADSDPVTAFWNEIDALRDVLKFEFFYPSRDEFHARIAAELTAQHPRWKSRLSKGGGAVMDLLGHIKPLVSHSTLRAFAEGYAILANALLMQSENEPVNDKAVLDLSLKFGKQAFLQRRVMTQESIAKLVFENALKLAHNRGVASGSTVQREQFAAQMRDFKRRIDLIQSLAASRRASLVNRNN